MSKTRHATLEDTIRTAFRESGLSIKRLAIQARLPYAVAHGFVTGNSDPRLSTVAKVCEALGLELRPARRRTAKGKVS